MRSGVAVSMGVLWIGLISSGCATAGRVKAPLAITQVGVEPKTLDPREHGQVKIRCSLTSPAAVFIDLIDEEGQVIRRIEAGPQPVGLLATQWDGRTAEGQAVPRGVYRYVIHAQDASGRQEIYNPSETGGEELQPRGFVFDQKTGVFRWIMPKAGRARLRVGMEGFPHLRTLLDWEPMEAGEQTFFWDGLDDSGLMNIKGHPNLSIKLSAFALPHNTIIVRGDPSLTVPLGQVSPYLPIQNSNKTAYFHAQHPPAVCHEIRLHIEFPGNQLYDPKGRPVLRGVVPIRVTLDERDAPHLVSRRFEVAIFEDLTFLSEEEDGSTPFTYLWDTTHLPLGEYLLTVNVLSYDDHYGVETKGVVIGSPS